MNSVSWHPGSVPATLAPLFAADERTVDFLRAIYSALGNAVTMRWSLSVKDKELQKSAGERETMLAQLHEQLASRQRDISALEDLLTSEREIATRRDEEFNAAIAEKERATRLEADLTAEHARVQRLRADITSERVRVQSLEISIAGERVRVQSLETSIAGEREHTRQLEADFTGERERGRRLKAELEHVRLDHNRLTKSVSWRVTAPMRRIFTRYPRASRSAVIAARAVWWIGTFQWSRFASAAQARARLREEEERIAEQERIIAEQERIVAEQERIVAESGLFSADFYLKNNPDAVGIDRTPLWHYLVRGWLDGRRPHPLFSHGAWYLEQYPEVAGAAMNPLVHFVERGTAELRNPNPFFETRWYMTMNPDVILSRRQPTRPLCEGRCCETRGPLPRFQHRRVP